MSALTTDQEALIRWAVGTVEVAHAHARENGRLAGYRFPGTAALLLGQGRLFTAARGFRSDLLTHRLVLDFAETLDSAYVEGWAVKPGEAALAMHVPHAWCAVEEAAVETTTGWPTGTVYLGVPMRPEFVRELHRRHGEGPVLWDGPAADELCRTGVPDDALVDVGVPLPDLNRFGFAASLTDDDLA